MDYILRDNTPIRGQVHHHWIIHVPTCTAISQCWLKIHHNNLQSTCTVYCNNNITAGNICQEKIFTELPNPLTLANVLFVNFFIMHQKDFHYIGEDNLLIYLFHRISQVCKGNLGSSVKFLSSKISWLHVYVG